MQSQKCGCNPVVSHFGGKPLSIARPGIIILWLVAAGLSVMAFDSGVTQESWNFVIAVWSHPVWPIAFAIAVWVAYARKKDRLAGVLTAFTFLPVLVLIIFMVLSNFFSLGL